MKVIDRHGRTWTVRRHWLRRDGEGGIGARWRRHRRRSKEDGDDGHILDFLDFLDIPGDGPFAAILFAIGALVTIVVLVVWGIPMLLVVFDLVLLVIVSIAGVVGRVLFRRPWTVEAVSDTGDQREAKVVGWRNSARAKRTLADEVLRLGPP